ncbi:MAG: Ig-like domain-containing protein [Oscillospiraceae bacterium]
MKRLRWLLAAVPMLLLLTISASADSVTDTISIYVGYYGWSEDEYVEKATYHWTELADWCGGVLDTHEEIYSYYSGSRTYLVAARGFYIRDLLSYAGIDVGSVARIDFFTKDHNNGAYRSFTAYSLLEMPRYYFPNLAANEETGAVYAYDGDDIWNGATTVEAMLALEDFTEWDVSGTEFEQLYDPDMMNANARFHLFFGQTDPTEASTSSAAKYCYKLLITFSGTPVLTTGESNLDMKIGSGRKLEIDVDAEDGLLNDYVRGHITWSSSDSSVVSVSEDGTITVHSAGDAVITASFGNSSVSINVHAQEGEESGAGGNAGTPDETDAGPSGQESVQPLPTEGGVTEVVSGKKVMTVSAQALAGTRSGNADAEDHSGGYMDEDTEQLVLTVPDRVSPALLTAAVLFLAFLLGGAYEIIRFKRLLRGTRK